jgi:hypothetical protein
LRVAHRRMQVLRTHLLNYKRACSNL